MHERREAREDMIKPENQLIFIMVTESVSVLGAGLGGQLHMTIDFD
jgi:hypothetical protein